MIFRINDDDDDDDDEVVLPNHFIKLNAVFFLLKFHQNWTSCKKEIRNL